MGLSLIGGWVSAADEVAGESALARLERKVTPAESRNPILQALRRADSGDLLCALELVAVERGEVVHDNHLRNDHVWMPLTCVLSPRIALSDGASMEAALCGEDGFVGVWATLGVTERDRFETRVVALRGGLAWRLPVPSFRQALVQCAEVRLAVLALQTQFSVETALRAICNRHHRIDRQLCRWLMLYRERARSDELIATQQELADILGVRREGITEALGQFAAAGVLELRRGGLQISDATRLAANACSCYRPVEDGRFSATNAKPTTMNASDRPAALRNAAG